jgi:Carboxypeptidase regulatory-like domain
MPGVAVADFFLSGTWTAVFSISGNAGIAGALVSYSGTSSGSVTADGSGNYSIGGLANGSYTITPSLGGYTFAPTSRNVTLSGSNITGVNFVATFVPPAGAGRSRRSK